ncbi:MAG: transporter substrate-binding domain-containing protein [Deltaproteobacteria bacterium]|nr:transporter substrate-binding domain-containing protein [Deltaproteobacteria bacterium]
MTKHGKEVLLVIVLAAVASAALFAAAVRGSERGVFHTITDRGELRVGVSVFAPWVMRDGNGELAGFEIDVARQLARDLGVGVSFVPAPWSDIIARLLAGRFDVIISGMSITPEREKTVAFTRPYAETGYILLASSARAKGRTLKDFDRPGVTIATRRGTTAAAAMRENFPKATLVYLNAGDVGYRRAAEGGVDAVSSTPAEAAIAIEKYGGALRVVSRKLLSPTREAFAVRKGDPEILDVLNTWIEEKRHSGWLKERHDYWFATRSWAKETKP